MSAERDHARWALRDDREVSRFAKLAWLMLDTRGEDPHPSISKLAADCSATRKTVKRWLRELEAAGWLRIEYRTTQQGNSDTSRYILLCPGQEGVGSRMTPPGGVTDDRGVGSAMTPKDQREDQQVEDQQNLNTTAYAGPPDGRPIDLDSKIIDDIDHQLRQRRGYGFTDRIEEGTAEGIVAEGRSRMVAVNTILARGAEEANVWTYPQCARPPGWATCALPGVWGHWLARRVVLGVAGRCWPAGGRYEVNAEEIVRTLMADMHCLCGGLGVIRQGDLDNLGGGLLVVTWTVAHRPTCPSAAVTEQTYVVDLAALAEGDVQLPGWPARPSIGQPKPRRWTPPPKLRRCAGRVKAGTPRERPCRNPPQPGSDYCQYHRTDGGPDA